MQLGWIIRKFVSEENCGALRYFLSPPSRHAWGGPMNGQGLRCRMVAELVINSGTVAIVETGTYRGTTTEWLSAFQLPIYTCEANAENFGYAHARLKTLKNVQPIHLDSREALRTLMKGTLSQRLNETILFYLDAHWENDLPLADEVDIIFSHSDTAIVMIDDFQVEGDEGYLYDDYGNGKELSLTYLDSHIRKHELSLYYPTKPSREETGARRGCVVLAKADKMASRFDKISLLRRQSDPRS